MPKRSILPETDMSNIRASFEVTSRFTKVPNEVLSPDFPLWKKPGAMRLWLQLLSLCPDRKVDSRQHLANLCGLTIHGLKKNLSILVADGYITSDLSLTLPQVTFTAPEEPEANLIAAEVQDKPNRASTGLSQADRWELIKAAWNTHKPERYMQLDGRINLPALIAIETQTKRLGVDRDDYDAFIGAVLRGAAADSWWSSKDLKLTQVFGFGANLEDKKFETVERLYKAGMAIKPRVEKASTFWSDDERVIAWYRSNVDNVPAGIRVERIKVENDMEAQDLEDWHAFTVLGEPTRDTQLFLYRRLQALLESGKLNYSAERFKGAARLYYQEGKPNPIWWTSRQTLPQPPTEN